jgi:hypothetical protein
MNSEQEWLVARHAETLGLEERYARAQAVSTRSI